MKSKAKQKTFINNMITYAIVVVAYIVIQILMGTGHMSSLMKGLLSPFLYLCDHGSFIESDSRYPGRVKPWTCRIYVCRCFFRGIVFQSA